MKLSACISFILFFVFSCQNNEKKEVIIEQQTENQLLNKYKKYSLKTFTYEDVSRYTMASIMGQSPKIITAIKNNNLYFVSYIRKSDNKKFEYKIKFDGNKIIWANIDGRWRDSKYDEKISFRENNQILYINQSFEDGSEDIQEYKKRE
ncbi:hypothetical protein [Pseudomonas shirazensis]